MSIFAAIIAMAQTSNAGRIAIEKHPTFAFQIWDGARLIVTINRDGSVKLGEGIKVDDAAKQFYESLRAHFGSCSGGIKQNSTGPNSPNISGAKGNVVINQ